ncbi:Eco57I restriction-modification methylase domain-containing protein [Lactococcus cremoris]|uniref:Eco57I restriction-modification methylase domain-containing protein n=1 Tax=Lactococcus lactis subsp. cremoris TaxID=1359 RepID=UPI0024A73191|nr:adenine methyltransferase [Lactococcus cremoris]
MSELKLENIVADEESVKILADYLGYTVGMNPVTENSDWRILFTDKLPDHSKGVLAVLPVKELTEESTTVEVRRLYKQVLDLRDEFSTGFEVQIVGFVGNSRIIFFPYQNGNRDMRLDLNPETLEIPLYKDNLALLKNDAISVKEDEFGFGAEIQVDAKVFKQQLSTHFLSVVAYYRKKLSELITSSQLKNSLAPLLDSHAKFWLDKNDLVNLVEQESYTAVLSNVVDTIILRQLMRRFLEGYYGSKSFEVEGIALGVGDGTMDEAIKKAVQAYVEIGDEDAIKKLNKKKKAIEEIDNSISLFEGFFDEDELGATTKVALEMDSKAKVKELTEKATEQFQAVYNGDLFAGSVGAVANQIENQMATDFPEVTAKLWLDTSAKAYSFRYEDLPPYAIEKQYENSMSQNVQIKIEEGQPIVFYGEDTIEQKNKGAYYTDNKFVDYMVKQTVDVEFNKRYEAIKQAISNNKKPELRKAILHLLDMKVADLTSGGGSFLRGAFLHLASKHYLLSVEIPQDLKTEFPYFDLSDESVYQWEKYVLEHMIYGVDIDYKAIIVSSLTLTLSSLEHRPADMKLPSLIGQNLIHQNSLMNSVPYYLRKEIFADFKDDIRLLRRAKINHQINFNEKREKLQQEFKKYVAQTLNGETEFLRVEALEINLPEVFFDENGCLLEDGGFDVIIGNPPWEVWKPNSDEFFSSYDGTYLALGKAKEKKKRQEELFNRFGSLKGKWDEYKGRFEKGSKYFRDDNNFKYQSWQVEGRKRASDINLYKISLERFYQLLKKGEHLSLLIPDNLMTDLGATGLRHMIFDKSQLTEFLSFENRQGIFKAVDGRYKFAVTTLVKSDSNSVSADETVSQSFKAFFYKQELSALQKEAEKLDYPLELVFAEPEKYSLFEPRSQVDFDLCRKIKLSYPPLLETKLFEVSNDFHRTNDSEYFHAFVEGEIPLYEGKLMEQFKVSPSAPESVTFDAAVRKTGDDFKTWRIGLRAVGRATDRRSLIATLFAPMTVGAHSLHLQRNAATQTVSTRVYLTGIINSYVIDFVLRQIVTTNISQTFLKQLPIPSVAEFPYSDEITKLSKSLLKKNGKPYDELDKLLQDEGMKNPTEFDALSVENLTAELNARVALGFKLTREEVINLMKTFESANHKKAVQAEAQRIIDVYDRLSGE